MTNIRNKCVADTRLFTHDPLTNAFSSEMSTLQANGIDVLAQLYYDACDQGFLMQSAKTERFAEWYLTEEHRNRDNDITHWTFAPTFATIRTNPKLVDATVYVWNT